MPTPTTYTDELVCIPRAGTLYDVLELILDRGMVIDVFIRVSLVGIEILKIDARIVVASVDTYLRFAEACNRLDLEYDRTKTLPELFGGGGGGGVVKKAVAKKAGTVREKAKKAIGADDEEEEGEETRPRRHTTARPRSRRLSEED
ncbi:gas vesicle protein GvpJ [Streptomyces sp. NPDC005336]|uniref:gas vesicle protein GvpJ n=1 Tax=unclassified Streptomyces TaxID=2593676 RepID=UPI0033B1F8C2